MGTMSQKSKKSSKLRCHPISAISFWNTNWSWLGLIKRSARILRRMILLTRLLCTLKSAWLGSLVNSGLLRLRLCRYKWLSCVMPRNLTQLKWCWKTLVKKSQKKFTSTICLLKKRTIPKFYRIITTLLLTAETWLNSIFISRISKMLRSSSEAYSRMKSLFMGS